MESPWGAKFLFVDHIVELKVCRIQYYFYSVNKFCLRDLSASTYISPSIRNTFKY